MSKANITLFTLRALSVQELNQSELLQKHSSFLLAVSGRMTQQSPERPERAHRFRIRVRFRRAPDTASPPALPPAPSIERTPAPPAGGGGDNGAGAGERAGAGEAMAHCATTLSQLPVRWHWLQSAVVGQWPAGRPLAEIPLWQLAQFVLMPLWLNCAGRQPWVEWQAPHCSVVTI